LQLIKLLSDPEIRGNYGARDMWQVIDQVAVLELGGAKTGSRYRTLATCGTIITAWLANNTNRIMSVSGPLLDMDEIRHPTPKLSGQKATTHPNDYDLVNACELWLTDTGTPDTRVEELSQPYESPVQTSRPIQVPAVVQDDASGEVLMVGFMNQEAWDITRRIGYVTFYSRTRNTLWTKGETSGNRLAVTKILVDCDDDTVLVKAVREGDGQVCHTGERTCFFKEETAWTEAAR